MHSMGLALFAGLCGKMLPFSVSSPLRCNAFHVAGSVCGALSHNACLVAGSGCGPCRQMPLAAPLSPVLCRHPYCSCPSIPFFCGVFLTAAIGWRVPFSAYLCLSFSSPAVRDVDPLSRKTWVQAKQSGLGHWYCSAIHGTFRPL